MTRISINIFLVSLLTWFFVASLFSNSASASPEEDADKLRNLLSTGKKFLQSGQYDKAMKNVQQALAIARTLGKEDGIATSLSNIGRVYRSWGQYDKAIENYQQALTIARKLGSENMVSKSLMNIEKAKKNIILKEAKE